MPTYLTEHEIVALHNVVINELGGAGGIRNEVSLPYIANYPEAINRNVPDDLDGIISNAVSYQVIVRSRPFLDGNLRTSAKAIEAFLTKNGYSIIGGFDGLMEQMAEISRARRTRRRLAQWLMDHVHPNTIDNDRHTA